MARPRHCESFILTVRYGVLFVKRRRAGGAIPLDRVELRFTLAPRCRHVEDICRNFVDARRVPCTHTIAGQYSCSDTACQWLVLLRVVRMFRRAP